jgi:predicted enzyme related to lactoylglutathione lyase
MKLKNKLLWISILVNVALVVTSFKLITKDTAHNPVVHFEIGCKDLAKTTEFYTSLFGWSPTGAEMASYINTNSTEGIQGHITSLGHEPYNYVTVYIQVDDIAAYLTKIQKAGGQKIVGPISIPGGQQFAWFKDLDGNVLGLITKAK